MATPIIFHVDVNAAFLSWEATYRLRVLKEVLDLRDIPSAIGGDIEKRRGVILAKSTPAKRYGIQTGEPVIAALSKCPNLLLVKPNHKLYSQYSHDFIQILKDYTPVVEQYSIDEAYMDMTGTEGLYGDPVVLAHKMKDRIEKELGFTVNVGISTNKLLAKIAGDFKKPNLVHTLFPDEIPTKLWPLPIRELIGVGKATEQKLKLLGINTIGKLAKTDKTLLLQHFNKQGEVLYQHANGIDSVLVMKEEVANKGYGNATTLPSDIASSASAYPILLSLCETVGERLRKDQAKACCIAVSLVDTYFQHSTHQITLPSGTNITKELYLSACKAFDVLWDHQTPIRQLGVHTSKLATQDSYQYNLFDGNKYDKYEKVDKAIDAIRDKFGKDSVVRAPFLVNKIGHMKD